MNADHIEIYKRPDAGSHLQPKHAAVNKLLTTSVVSGWIAWIPSERKPANVHTALSTQPLREYSFTDSPSYLLNGSIMGTYNPQNRSIVHHYSNKWQLPAQLHKDITFTSAVIIRVSN